MMGLKLVLVKLDVFVFVKFPSLLHNIGAWFEIKKEDTILTIIMVFSFLSTM